MTPTDLLHQAQLAGVLVLVERGRLVIRGDAAPSARPAVEAFAGALRGALAASPYPVPAGG